MDSTVFQNPDEQERCALLRRIKNIAVVGLSPNPSRLSYGVAQAMQGYGFTIIPVHPVAAEVLGAKAYRRLADVPVPIDLVNVFRRAREAGMTVAMDRCISRYYRSISTKCS